MAACVPVVSARFIETTEVNNIDFHPEQLYLVETAPGKTQWVTEEEKWELRRVCHIPNFSLSFVLVLTSFSRMANNSWT